MSGKKDHAIVVVMNNLTSTQAANISADIEKSKFRRAPNARGTIVTGQRKDVGVMLEKGQRQTSLNVPQEVKAIEQKKKPSTSKSAKTR